MSLRGKELFSQEQKDEFMRIPEDEWVLGTYYTFSKQDLEIIKRHRTDENKIGFALQIAVLRYPGWPYSYVKSIPKSVISYIYCQANRNRCDSCAKIPAEGEYALAAFVRNQRRVRIY